MKLLVVAAVVVLALYVYFALYSPHVFDVLIYDESKLMPADIEPKIVESIVKKAHNDSLRTIPVVLYGPSLEDKARNLSKLFPDSVTPWSILDVALQRYNNAVNEIVDNATARFKDAALQLSNYTTQACRRLAQLVDAYRDARETAKRLLAATYGVAALGKAVDNKTSLFLETYRRYTGLFDVDTAVRLAADVAYGNASRYLANVTWRTWASEGAVRNVTLAILSAKLNTSLIKIAEEADAVGVYQYVYVSVLNKTPPPLRPYLPLIVCKDDVEEAVKRFRSDLLRNLTETYPPPTLFSIPAASSLYYQGKYALALVKTSEELPHIPSTLGTPVSTSFLLQSFRRVVTEDVSKIDRATAVSLFAVLLAVMGTVLTPILIVATVGTTYLAVLGFFYQTAHIYKTYYLTVYMAAPVVFAIGVDYMLLMASRYAEERAKGLDKQSAATVVRRYANRAIAASAAVVATSLGSFALSRLPFMQSIGVGYVITTALVVATVFIVFPALLYLLGDLVFWPKKTAATHTGRSRLMEKAVSLALGRPLLVALVATAATLLAFLFLVNTLRITANPVVAMPETEYKKALEVATTYFSNVTSLSTTYIVLKSPPPPGLLKEVESLPHYVNYTVEEVGGWHVVSIKLSVEDTSDKLLSVYQRLSSLRGEYGNFLIGGAASWKNVVYNEIYVKFWNFQVYVVVGLVYLILAVLLRSFLIPLRLIATVLMSIAWSLAIEVLLFQEALGQPTYWLVPVVLFAFLMAVGTDYDIFIVARIREELEKGLGEREAVRQAIITTGPVITGAAVILAAAFSTLMLSQVTLLRQVGFTIAFAALVDAFIIRPLVVPALMTLAGKYNWLWIRGYSVRYINA